ncbi:Gfo/Idh/MocA family oxidoreductase [Paenibacillus sp. TRM 82003]|nr:Gfo/Idh/MocA family oxidoreductase [Paenibacillus sp. TRM 82003]
MGSVHARAYARMPGVELAGVCDANAAAAVKLADAVGTAGFEDAEALFAEGRPDVVSICLPTPLHRRFTEQAAKAGVHVVCEKPIANTLEDAEAMIRVCEAHGVRLFIGHVVRFFPSYEDIARNVARGSIGRVGVAHARRVGGHPGKASAWYGDRAASGGPIMDVMIHDIDFMRSVLGEVDRVFASERTAPGVEHALVTLRFRNGAIANMEAMWGYEGPFTTAVDLSGTKGTVRYRSDDPGSITIRRSLGEEEAGPRVSVPQSPLHQSPYYRQLEHFLHCIREDATPIVSAVDGYMALAIALAAMRSIRIEAPVRMTEYLEGKEATRVE